MTGHYLFTCDGCGSTTPLALKQAGQEIPCSGCDKSLQAPKLGDIRKLPFQEDEAQKGNAAGRNYSPLQGWLFAGGLTLAVITGLAAWQLQSYASTLVNKVDLPAEVARFNKEVDGFSPAEIYEITKIAKEDFAMEYEEPSYRKFNRQSEILMGFAYGLWGLCGLGLLMLVCSFFIKGKP